MSERQPAPRGGSDVEEARRRLISGAAELGLTLDERVLSRLDRYAALLQEGRAAANLTALSGPIDIAEKHFLDSLAVVPALPKGRLRVIDVGSGAGFPGLVIKIVRPELEMVLLEVTRKKAAWLEQTIDALDLGGVVAVAERAETLAHDPDHRGAYDVALARAVAPLATLCELCLPFLRVGGRLIAQKTVAGADVEVAAANGALEQLSAHLVTVAPVHVSALPNRVLVVVKQDRPVPPQYPRRPGMPAKRPLGNRR